MNAHNEQHDSASPVVKQNLTTQPAAAQEPAAEVIGINGRNGVEIHWLAGPVKIGDLLYTAPVTAAPGIDPHALGLLEVLGAKDFADASNIVGGLLADASPKGGSEARAYTTGHCENHKKPGGCPLHNLQCGYPQCDRQPASDAEVKA